MQRPLLFLVPFLSPFLLPNGRLLSAGSIANTTNIYSNQSKKQCEKSCKCSLSCRYKSMCAYKIIAGTQNEANPCSRSSLAGENQQVAVTRLCGCVRSRSLRVRAALGQPQVAADLIQNLGKSTAAAAASTEASTRGNYY